MGGEPASSEGFALCSTFEGTHSICKGIRLSQPPDGFGNVTCLAGIDHRHRQSSRGQRRNHGPLVASRGFEDDQIGLHGLESCHQGGNPAVIIRQTPTFAGGP
jgi:hypothetical protein